MYNIHTTIHIDVTKHRVEIVKIHWNMYHMGDGGGGGDNGSSAVTPVAYLECKLVGLHITMY